MNFSNTNFPRSYHAPRDTVTRSRQAVTTVITFLPLQRFVFLSHNQVTILIAFAFLTRDTALSPARFIGRNADPFLPPPSFLSFLSHSIPSPKTPSSLATIRGASYLRLPEVDLNSFAFAIRACSFLPSRLLSLLSPLKPLIFFHCASDGLCFFLSGR